MKRIVLGILLVLARSPPLRRLCGRNSQLTAAPRRPRLRNKLSSWRGSNLPPQVDGKGLGQMLLAEVIAFAMLLTATGVGALDTRPGRAALYVVVRYRRRRRAARSRTADAPTGCVDLDDARPSRRRRRWSVTLESILSPLGRAGRGCWRGTVGRHHHS
jgi:hypothetical protein